MCRQHPMASEQGSRALPHTTALTAQHSVQQNSSTEPHWAPCPFNRQCPKAPRIPLPLCCAGHGLGGSIHRMLCFLPSISASPLPAPPVVIPHCHVHRTPPAHRAAAIGKMEPSPLRSPPARKRGAGECQTSTDRTPHSRCCERSGLSPLKKNKNNTIRCGMTAPSQRGRGGFGLRRNGAPRDTRGQQMCGHHRVSDSAIVSPPRGRGRRGGRAAAPAACRHQRASKEG